MAKQKIGKRQILTILRRDLKTVYGARNAGIIANSFDEQADWEELEDRLKNLSFYTEHNDLTGELILEGLGVLDWESTREGGQYWSTITEGLDAYLTMFTNHLIGS